MFTVYAPFGLPQSNNGGKKVSNIAVNCKSPLIVGNHDNFLKGREVGFWTVGLLGIPKKC